MIYVELRNEHTHSTLTKYNFIDLSHTSAIQIIIEIYHQIYKIKINTCIYNSFINHTWTVNKYNKSK